MRIKNTALAGAAMTALALAAPAQADLSFQAGDWTVAFDGNVNTFYMITDPRDDNTVYGGLAATETGAGTSATRQEIRTGLLPSFHLEAGGPRGPMDVELSASDAIALLLDSGLPPCLELAAEPNWDREGLEDPGPAEEHRDDHRAGERS